MKFLAEIEVNRVKFTKLKKRTWQMVSTRAGKLYRVDDFITVKDSGGDDAIVLYPDGGVEPLDCRGTFINPDDTRALIHSSKISNTSKDIWTTINRIDITQILTFVVVGGAMLWWVLSQLGA